MKDKTKDTLKNLAVDFGFCILVAIVTKGNVLAIAVATIYSIVSYAMGLSAGIKIAVGHFQRGFEELIAENEAAKASSASKDA